MKNVFRVIAQLAILTAVFSMFSCSDDEDIVDKFPPTLELALEEVVGLPGDLVTIKGEVLDETGIKTILIESIDWEIAEKIVFSTQNYIKKYSLNQSVTIPQNAPRGSTAEIRILISDFAGNTTTKVFTVKIEEEPITLNIDQTMGYNIVIDGGIAKVTGNDVEFVMNEDVELPVQLKLSSNRTKLSTLTVVCKELGLNEVVDLSSSLTENGTKAAFKNTYSLMGNNTELNFLFTLEDENGNTASYSPKVSIKSTFANHNLQHNKIFVLDRSVDLSKFVYGIPMLGQSKSVESYRFEMDYLAENDNTEILLVSSRNEETQVKYGMSNDDNYIIKSDSPNSIVLSKKGYYRIKVDLLLGSIEVNSIEATKSPYQNMYIGGSFDGYSGQEMIEMDDTRYTIQYTFAGAAELSFGIGGGEWLVATGPENHDPEIWLLKADKDKYTGAPFFDTSIPAGTYTIIFDTFLMKSYMFTK